MDQVAGSFLLGWHRLSPARVRRAALPAREPRVMCTNFLHRLMSVFRPLAAFHVMLPPFSCCLLGQSGAAEDTQPSRWRPAGARRSLRCLRPRSIRVPSLGLPLFLGPEGT